MPDQPRYCLSVGSDDGTRWSGPDARSYYFDDLDVALSAWELLECYARPEIAATLEDRVTSKLAILHHRNPFTQEAAPRLRADIDRVMPSLPEPAQLPTQS